MRFRFAVIILAAAVLIGLLLLINRNQVMAPVQQNERSETPENENQDQPAFSNPKKSAHYESNTPEHGAILAAAPTSIVINFNFDLAAPSDISVTNNGTEYAKGELIIDTNKLTMRKTFDANAPDGVYKVAYKACWPDKSCHDGSFEFAINRNAAVIYQDLTLSKDVEIKMSDIMFKPMDIKISKGTKVTWVNDEHVTHYVNTDSHPAHTYFMEQNSQALEFGDEYSVTFDAPGLYPYHCSAHADMMKGSILVI